MRCVLSSLVVLLWCQAPAFAQTPYVPEAPAFLCAGDFDADGIDDVLLLGLLQKSRTYFGSRVAPHLKAGPAWSFDAYYDLVDTPVFVGGFLYVPVTTTTRGSCEVRVYQLVKGRWWFKNAVPIGPSVPGVAVTSVRIHALHKDIDNDKQNDVIAVWGEVPHSNGGFYASYLSPSGASTPLRVPSLRGQSNDAVVVDIHRVKILSPKSTPEYVVSLSCDINKPVNGFGFMTLTEGPKFGSGVWAGGGPALAYAKFVTAGSPVSYGQFNILPVVKTPLVQLSSGESILFAPGLLAPYVTKSAEILQTHKNQMYLEQALADYDGDGRDEAVLAVGKGYHTMSCLLVGDPSSTRAYSQFFPSDRGGPTNPPLVYHATAGDFDGDGDPDLLVSYIQDSRSGHLGLFIANRSKGPGKPALRRLY